ncbi:hypothetical protein B0H17DRAFT_1138535 [Mycena rosella]|uniref:Uncharacterized protein n=1 Tax=Mycena rosella TaxID=1033263 RepID=A0AAD7GDI4_MYCRO|nr:hypothetical protein B0H17DRAFT_1138535 [Mycena rosella]
MHRIVIKRGTAADQPITSPPNLVQTFVGHPIPSPEVNPLSVFHVHPAIVQVVNYLVWLTTQWAIVFIVRAVEELFQLALRARIYQIARNGLQFPTGYWVNETAQQRGSWYISGGGAEHLQRQFPGISSGMGGVCSWFLVLFSVRGIRGEGFLSPSGSGTSIVEEGRTVTIFCNEPGQQLSWGKGAEGQMCWAIRGWVRAILRRLSVCQGGGGAIINVDHDVGPGKLHQGVVRKFGFLKPNLAISLSDFWVFEAPKSSNPVRNLGFRGSAGNYWTKISTQGSQVHFRRKHPHQEKPPLPFGGKCEEFRRRENIQYEISDGGQGTGSPEDAHRWSAGMRMSIVLCCKRKDSPEGEPGTARTIRSAVGPGSEQQRTVKLAVEGGWLDSSNEELLVHGEAEEFVNLSINVHDHGGEVLVRELGEDQERAAERLSGAVVKGAYLAITSWDGEDPKKRQLVEEDGGKERKECMASSTFGFVWLLIDT